MEGHTLPVVTLVSADPAEMQGAGMVESNENADEARPELGLGDTLTVGGLTTGTGASSGTGGAAEGDGSSSLQSRPVAVGEAGVALCDASEHLNPVTHISCDGNIIVTGPGMECSAAVAVEEEEEEVPNGIYEYQVLDCYREVYDLSLHRGFPLIICNVASKCKYAEAGFRNLCTLFERYSPYGFTVLAFPCNQFGSGEPHNAEELEKQLPKLFPSVMQSVDFPIMCKVDVNGDRELPLYGYLKSCLKGTVGQTAINWNFTYFVVGADGVPVARLGPETKLEELDRQVRVLLNLKDEEP